jgi:hypothetical protein
MKVTNGPPSSGKEISQEDLNHLQREDSRRRREATDADGQRKKPEKKEPAKGRLA